MTFIIILSLSSLPPFLLVSADSLSVFLVIYIYIYIFPCMYHSLKWSGLLIYLLSVVSLPLWSELHAASLWASADSVHAVRVHSRLSIYSIYQLTLIYFSHDPSLCSPWFLQKEPFYFKGLVKDEKEKVIVSVDWLMESRVRTYQVTRMKTGRAFFPLRDRYGHIH